MSDQSNPSLVNSHAQYAKGAAVETIGNATGSTEWQTSGSQQKTEAVDEMRAAGAQRDRSEQGYGKAEQLAGKAVGCEGMEVEGEASKKE